jgi:hypothetical protein
MDRVFETLEPSGSRAESPRAEPLSALPSASPKPPRLSTPVALVIGLTLVSAVAGLFSMLLWRSWMEARQDLHLDFDPSFVPTPNARNAAMLREAADFAAALKRCEKDIRGVKNAAEGE